MPFTDLTTTLENVTGNCKGMISIAKQSLKTNFIKQKQSLVFQ